MIEVEPEVKVKGFRPENLSKIDTSKEFYEVKSRNTYRYSLSQFGIIGYDR